MNQLKTAINKIALAVTGLTVFALPLFFLPLTTNFYDWNKHILLLGSGLALLLLWALKCVATGQVVFKSLPLTKTLLAYLVVAGLSTVVNPDYMSSLMGPLVFLVGLLIFYLGVGQAVEDETATRKVVAWSTVAAAVVLALVSISQQAGLFTKLFSAPWLGSAWTPAGSPFAQIPFYLVALAILAFKAYQEVSRPDEGGGLKAGVLISLTMLVAFALGSNILQTIAPQGKRILAFERLPYSEGWSIATGVLGSSPKAAFLGAGLGNFASAFGRYKTTELRSKVPADLIFLKSSNEPFHILATTGLLGLLAWSAMILYFVKDSLRKLLDRILSREPVVTEGQVGWPDAAILGLILVQLLLPPTFATWFLLLVVLLARFEKRHQSPLQLSPGALLATSMATTLALSYLVVRGYQGEISLYQAAAAASQNRGADTYNLQVTAINANPVNYTYHQNFSVTNRLLAESLLQDLAQKSKQSDGEKESSEAAALQRQNAGNLVQQAINEAKVAVRLAPNRSETWKNLGAIYESLNGLVDGVASSAVSAYQTSSRLSPLDADLRRTLGNLILSQGDVTEGLYQLRLALQADPTAPSGWYSLAVAYQQAGDLARARASLQKTLDLLPADSPDRERVQQELSKLAQPAEVSEETPSPPGQ